MHLDDFVIPRSEQRSRQGAGLPLLPLPCLRLWRPQACSCCARQACPHTFNALPGITWRLVDPPCCSFLATSEHKLEFYGCWDAATRRDEVVVHLPKPQVRSLWAGWLGMLAWRFSRVGWLAGMFGPLAPAEPLACHPCRHCCPAHRFWPPLPACLPAWNAGWRRRCACGRPSAA